MGFLTEKFGCRAVSVGGTILVVLGRLPFLWMIQNHFSPILLAVSLFARGAGQAAIGIPSLSAAYASVPQEKLALATTATNIVQRLGGPVATTIMATVLSLSATHFPSSGPRAFFIAFIVLIAQQSLVLSAAAFLPVRIHQPTLN
jgi:MFS family permease